MTSRVVVMTSHDGVITSTSWLVGEGVEVTGTIATTGFLTSELARKRGVLELRMFWMERALLVVKTGRGEDEIGRELGGREDPTRVVEVVGFFSFSSSVLLSIDTSPASENELQR